MYPINSRIRYRDQLDGPTGVVVGHYYSQAQEQWQYEIAWTDYAHVMTQTVRFVDSEMEIW